MAVAVVLERRRSAAPSERGDVPARSRLYVSWRHSALRVAICLVALRGPDAVLRGREGFSGVAVCSPPRAAGRSLGRDRGKRRHCWRKRSERLPKFICV